MVLIGPGMASRHCCHRLCLRISRSIVRIPDKNLLYLAMLCIHFFRWNMYVCKDLDNLERKTIGLHFWQGDQIRHFGDWSLWTRQVLWKLHTYIPIWPKFLGFFIEGNSHVLIFVQNRGWATFSQTFLVALFVGCIRTRIIHKPCLHVRMYYIHWRLIR
jgi:hypothetical protein